MTQSKLQQYSCHKEHKQIYCALKRFSKLDSQKEVTDSLPFLFKFSAKESAFKRQNRTKEMKHCSQIILETVLYYNF